MSNKKQTAVEWLKKELEEYGSSSELKLDWITFDELIEQALQMEKEQIVDSFKEGLKSPYHQDYALVTQEEQEATKSGQYYNETYGGHLPDVRKTIGDRNGDANEMIGGRE